MELKPTFQLAPETALAPRPTIAGPVPPPPLQIQDPASVSSALGPLSILLKPGDVTATWEGEGGFNIIWRPHFDAVTPANDHFLELNLIKESITFSRIPGAIPNRGLLQEFISMFGINYLDQISDVNVRNVDNTQVGLHFEPGIWATVPPTANPLEPQTVVRMASIPHGTAMVAQGTIDPSPIPGPPTIGPSSITPFVIGQPANLISFPNESMIENNSQFTTPLSQRSGITQEMVDDPNSVLRARLADVTVAETTTIRVSTGSTPVPGGGTANTAFLSGSPGTTPDANANARAAQVTATLWIMRVTTAKGATETWLQYSQTVLLNFRGLSWPHVTVGTLILQP